MRSRVDEQRQRLGREPPRACVRIDTGWEWRRGAVALSYVCVCVLAAVESKRNTIRRGFVHDLLNAQDTVLCSYFAPRKGTKNDGCGQKNEGEEIFQGTGKI